jgi:hypothetical protein
MTKRKPVKHTVTTDNPGCLARLQKYGRYAAMILGACCIASFMISLFAPPSDDGAIPTALLLPTSTAISTNMPAPLAAMPTNTPFATVDSDSTAAFIATIAVDSYRASETAAVQAQIASQPSATQQPAILTNTPMPTNDPLIITVEAMQTALGLTQNAPTHTRIPPTQLPTATRIIVTPSATAIPSINRTGGTTRYANTGDVRIRTCPQGGAAGCEVIAVLASGEAITTYGTREGSVYDGSTLWYETVYNGRDGFVHTRLVQSSPPVVAPTTVPSSSSSVVNPPASSAVTSNCSCASDTLNCNRQSFNSLSDARACYNKCMAEVGRDVHGLDGNDNDGNICESGL